MKILYVFVAHIDDLEFSCLGYLLNSKYDKIKVIIATTWEAKEKIFHKNLKLPSPVFSMNCLEFGGTNTESSFSRWYVSSSTFRFPFPSKI